MGKDGRSVSGIIAYITTDKNRHLGGATLSLLAKDNEELGEISEAIAEAFLANILELVNGDRLIIKK